MLAAQLPGEISSHVELATEASECCERRRLVHPFLDAVKAINLGCSDDIEAVRALFPPPTPRPAIEQATPPELTGVTLDDYLKKLQAITGRVRFAGDTEDHPIGEVFVDLEITHAGRIEPDVDAADRDGDDGLRIERLRRPHTPLAFRPNQQVLSPVALLELGSRVLVVGAAGTGKSTLLRWLAWHTAGRHLANPERRVPLWLPRVPSYRDFTDGTNLADEDARRALLADELARRALLAVKLADPPGPARQQLSAAIVDGRAVVLIDSLDEASAEEQSHLAPWLPMITSLVILASRPRHIDEPWQDTVRVTLHGIPALDAERMLHSYYPGQPWVKRFVSDLQSLPDGRAWLETPMLLGLAVTVFRGSGEHLPTSILELYQQAVTVLLDSDRIPSPRSGNYHRSQLRQFARQRLLPENGPPRVVFDLTELPERDRLNLLHTGLFDGTTQLRFSHLSLGELLAAEDDIDLASARARLAAVDAVDLEGSALEVLPMAHAIQAPTALAAAHLDARTRDRPDHRLLRLLFQSIGYGGPGIREFCRAHADALFALLIERLQTHGGRFSDHERRLMDTAERALLLLHAFLSREACTAALAPLLRTRGEAAAEAHAITWLLDLAPATRAPTSYWATIHRQARALVRLHPSVEHIRRFTDGGTPSDVENAIWALGPHAEHRPRLRRFLDHPIDDIRRTALSIHHESHDSIPDLLERLTDDDDRIRATMLEHPATPIQRRRRALLADPSMRVRAAAVRSLAEDPWAIPRIRRIFADTIIVPPTFDDEYAALHGEVLRALADDATVSTSLRELLEAGNKHFYLWTEALLRDLARTPAWRAVLLRRLEAPDVAPAEVAAMASDPNARQAIRRLLAHPDEEVVEAAIAALHEPTADDRRVLVNLLDHSSHLVRHAAITRLGESVEDWPSIRRLIDGGENYDRTVAIRALAADPTLQDRGFCLLHEDPEDSIRLAVIPVLARSATGRAALREFFALTTTRRRHEVDEKRKMHLYGMLRGQILEHLATGPHALDRALFNRAVVPSHPDPHPEARESAVRALARNPPYDPPLHLLDDPVREVRHAAGRAMADLPEVQSRLLPRLDFDDRALRTSAFAVLVDHADARADLRALVRDPRTPDNVRETLLQPLARDSESLPDIRRHTRDLNRGVRLRAYSILHHDAEFRDMLRHRIEDFDELAHLSLDVPAIRMIADDPLAWPILWRHWHAAIAARQPEHLAVLVNALAHDPALWPLLRDYVEHEDRNLQWAAIRALGNDRTADEILQGLMTSPDDDVRRASADALRGVPSARPHYLPLLFDRKDDIRRIAVEVVRQHRHPDATQALLARLIDEPSAKLRVQLLEALTDRPPAIDELRRRLHDDPSSAVRIAAARVLGARRHGAPLEQTPAIARVLTILRGEDTDSSQSHRLRAWLDHPTPLDLDADPELADLMLAWLCIRLTWAADDGCLTSGRLYGELEHPTPRITAPGLLVIRVAMDVSNLPRERLLRPTHNLTEAWSIARYLYAKDPPAILLACADVDFTHLSPPTMGPGESLWGPTFFGFRIRRSLAGAERVDPGMPDGVRNVGLATPLVLRNDGREFADVLVCGEGGGAPVLT